MQDGEEMKPKKRLNILNGKKLRKRESGDHQWAWKHRMDPHPNEVETEKANKRKWAEEWVKKIGAPEISVLAFSFEIESAKGEKK